MPLSDFPYLDNLYGPARTPASVRYDSLHFPKTNALLQPSLAARVFGHGNETLLQEVSTGEVTYGDLIAKNVHRVLNDKSENAVSVRSQLLHIGLAALSAFVQSNVTGPPLQFSPSQVVIPEELRGTTSALQSLRDRIVRSLTVDGEAIYKLTPNVELFCAAKVILNEAQIVAPTAPENAPELQVPLVARTARMRVNFLHQKMLSECASSLQTLIYDDLEELSKAIFDESQNHSSEDKARFLLERATIHTHHGFDVKARADLERAAQETGFQYALTGRLGRRTKFQNRDITQLLVLAKSASDGSEGASEEKVEEKPTEAASKPQNLDLNDDTLLEAISFKKDEPSGEKFVTVQEESSLPPALAALDPSNQPKLNPLDSIILLSLASSIKNTSPEHGLTREETLPYATRVLEGGSSNWQIYSQALLLRSRIEGYRSRTVERGLLQLQALVDQVIADTASSDSAAANGESTENVSTFLPRPQSSESASAEERLEYLWLLDFGTRWDLEAELASRWVELGGLRTALEIYERLQMWAEVALCYAATEREDKARLIVRRQLYLPTNAEIDENDTFEGPEISPLPANAPRLFCILGEIDKDPAMFERGWEVSNHRYARAQRYLARHYLSLKPPQYEKAEEAYQKSLAINRTNHGAWFALGCVQLELEKWKDAVDSFTRTVQLEDSDAEAWSNLAAALMNLPPPTAPAAEKSGKKAELREDEEDQFDVANETPDPYKHHKEALGALKQAARLKHSDHRIWDNVLTVSASIPPPDTPFRDIVFAQKRLIEIRGPKQGEKCVDVPILTAIVKTLTSDYNFDTPQSTSGKSNVASAPTIRPGTLPAQIIKLLDENVIPLITHSSALWLLVSRVEKWRGRPSRALAAHEKAWRATVASCTQAAFQMGDKKKWNDVVLATERLVREGYATLGPMDREREEGQEGEQEEELVAKDWRFKSRSAIRGILGKGKEFWEDTEEWKRLKELSAEFSGGNV
ncbi:hypothetical protein AJ80_02024 [Polytolypa hystricis UAMH7299]|uniref:Uncharacterized protein n=1 Tax=Polytolypa hystricis (strain UAMH7299) TaxID=1447883 RepID=A0A2B7YSW5_POLH7|nr:hypothetical protein AJ80_02024 [Polytolypa hystricis UAMH7299]